MMATHPFSLHTFIPSGNPAGLKVIEKSLWTGIGLVVPRTVMDEAKQRDEMGRAGVYVLVGDDEEGGLDKVYIGEGDPVGKRIERHHSTREFWTHAAVFTTKDLSLNKAHVQYLEAALIDLANRAKRCKIENNVQPKKPTLTAADQADAEAFLEDLILCLHAYGYAYFEARPAPRRKSPGLHLAAKGVNARGYESAAGFVVLKGSQVSVDEVDSISNGARAARRTLVEEGIIDASGPKMAFAQDYVFNSPSLAAGVVIGSSANGRDFWKTADGQTLKDLQEKEATDLEDVEG